MKKCVITVVGKDTVGIIAKVCEYLAVVSKELEEIGTSIGVAIHCQREEIFEKMHRL